GIRDRTVTGVQTCALPISLVLLLLLISAPPRLLGLDSLPPGLWHDEAYEGIDAIRIVAGARPAFLPENYGREPLYAYVMAGLIEIGRASCRERWVGTGVGG